MALSIVKVVLVVDDVSELCDELNPFECRAVEFGEFCLWKVLLDQPCHCGIGPDSAQGWIGHPLLWAVHVELIDP